MSFNFTTQKPAIFVCECLREKEMENYQIIISRASSLLACGLKYGVEIDGISAGFLKNGETISISTYPGNHTISFLHGRKVDKTISVYIPQGQQITAFRLRINVNGKPEITRDNLGGIEDFSPSSNKTPRRKTGIAVALAIVFLFIYVVIKFGDDNSSQSSQSDTAAVQDELTDEEKAVQLLEEATAEFQDGDYMSAIELCGEISAEYPDTNTAAGVNDYLSQQFDQFPHFTAADLMGEYDANIVNADEKYTDTVMVVSGTVSSIGKTNHDTNLTVMLNSGTYFYGVQLNFKTSQTDAVAALSEGDHVTAIGKCTGKSGTVLLVLDGNNVMIENCYLIG